MIINNSYIVFIIESTKIRPIGLSLNFYAFECFQFLTTPLSKQFIFRKKNKKFCVEFRPPTSSCSRCLTFSSTVKWWVSWEGGSARRFFTSWNREINWKAYLPQVFTLFRSSRLCFDDDTRACFLFVCWVVTKNRFLFSLICPNTCYIWRTNPYIKPSLGFSVPFFRRG